MRAAAALYGIVGSLALTALAAAPAAGTGPATASPETRGVATAVADAAADGIKWGRCHPDEELAAPAKCGTVSVPLDYAHPEGRKLKLDVSRAKATEPKERQGALVFNPGGPGGSGMYFPQLAASPEWSKVAKAYDFIGYAPRGVERTGRISCQDPKVFNKAPTDSPQRPTEAEKRERIAEAQAYARGCARIPGLRHYTSLNNARDLEVLRAALGEKKLNFVGASYGTYFGALYATLFPQHVRRFVFDSVVDPRPEQIWYGNNLRQSAAFEKRWAAFHRWAAGHDDSYRLGNSAREVRAAYEKVRAAVEAKPAGGKIGTKQLQSAFLKTGYADEYWPYAATALSDYLAGKPQTLVDFAAVSPEDHELEENGNAVYTAVECNDAPWPRDWATWDRDNTALARKAPFETWDNVWMNLPCAFWPTAQQRPAEIGTQPGATPPVLILAAEDDAATPYAGARELLSRIPDASLVTERDSGSHGISGGPNQCVNGHVDAYLLHGTTPGTNALQANGNNGASPREATCAPHKTPKGDRQVLPGDAG
ncbi:alpha/beta hydrolase [Streptomyces boninensis]|uniref:alpha/beta hydrolase n=1 Tax=Streptomyces boninensis TaxID=2039455 RepID=UPI003B20C046